MQVATGKSILNGIAIGPLRIYHKAARQTVVSSSLTPAEEWERFDAARKKYKWFGWSISQVDDAPR